MEIGAGVGVAGRALRERVSAMQRVRRLARIAVAITVGGLVLTGCRAQPGVAAYVGDDQITEQQVTQIVDDVKEKFGDGERAVVPPRGAIVTTLVLGDVCARLAAEKGYQPRSQVSAEQVAQAVGLPADATYARKAAELYSCLSGVGGEPVAPTAEELADVVNRGKAAGVIPPEKSVADVAAQLDGEQLRAALATRRALAEAVSRYDVTVNPRYRPLEYQLLGFQGNAAAVSVPLGEGASGAVTDRG